MTPAERARRRQLSKEWHAKRRAREICQFCPNPIKETNPRTGRLYWACLACRRSGRAS